MKICPRCQKTYQDDSLNYCLDDGTQLTSFAPVESAETIFMGHPPVTSPTADRGGSTVPVGWTVPPALLAHKQKSSRAWIWIIAILLLVILVCGGGIGGMIFYSYGLKDDTVSTSPSGPNSPALSKAKADQIRDGMSLSEVRQLLGSDGERFSTTSGGGVTFENYRWTDTNYAYVIITFTDGKVFSVSKGGFKE